MRRLAELEQTRPTGNGRARGLVSSRVSGRRVEARTYAPGESLRPFVECLWMSSWDLRGQAPHRTEILGDPCVHVVFERGQSRLVGVCTRLWTRELSGEGAIRAAKIHAGAIRAFTDRPAHELTDRVAPLAELSPDALSLERELFAIDDEVESLLALERWLCSLVRRPVDPQVSLAVQLVEHVASRPDLLTAEALVRASGLSMRPLQKLFRSHVGASPKWVIRRFRLQEAALRLERDPSLSIAELAAELGYSDHAHLTRDFKAATGRSPSEFVRSVHR